MSPFTGVTWSPAFIAFLVYVASIVTQRVPVGTATMSIALLTLVLERRALRFPPLVLFMLAFVGWAAVGWATTNYPSVVADRLSDMAKLCAITFVAVNVLTSRQRLRVLLVWMMLAFFAYPLRGSVFNYLAGYLLQGRLVWNGMYNNPNDLACLFLLQFALVLGILQVERQRWIRAIAFVSALLIPFLILVTQSRGAFVALVAFLLIIARRYVRSAKRFALASILVLSAALFTPSSAWTRLTDIVGSNAAASAKNAGEADVSAAQRIAVWEVARALIADNPVTGVGLGAYPDAHALYAQSPRFSPLAHGARDTHNTYLNVFAETGVVGFACFLGLIVVTLMDARKTHRRFALSSPQLASQLFLMEIGAYGYLIAGIWGSYGGLVPTYLYFAIIWSTAQLLRESATRSSMQLAQGEFRSTGGMRLVHRVRGI